MGCSWGGSTSAKVRAAVGGERYSRLEGVGIMESLGAEQTGTRRDCDSESECVDEKQEAIERS